MSNRQMSKNYEWACVSSCNRIKPQTTGHAPVVEVMCDFAPGVIKDTSKGGFTVLTIAAQHGHLQVLSQLTQSL